MGNDVKTLRKREAERDDLRSQAAQLAVGDIRSEGKTRDMLKKQSEDLAVSPQRRRDPTHSHY